MERIPARLHGHTRVTAHHVTVVALVLAAAMALAAWLVLRSVPQEVSTPRRAALQLPSAPPTRISAVPPAPTAVASGAPTAASAADGSSGGAVVVHVAGRVRRPGVVELPAGARVVDAIEAAGGARRRARLGHLNLARRLVDGEQVAVGVPGARQPPPGVSAARASSTAVTTATAAPAAVNLNTATQAELEELPGVGPVTATSIIAWRTEHGGFSTVDELLEVSGIGEVTLADLRDLVTV